MTNIDNISSHFSLSLYSVETPAFSSICHSILGPQSTFVLRHDLLLLFFLPPDLDVSPMTDIVERVNDIYMAVVESEECMERVACEIGGLAKDVGLQENSIAK